MNSSIRLRVEYTVYALNVHCFCADRNDFGEPYLESGKMLWGIYTYFFFPHSDRVLLLDSHHRGFAGSSLPYLSKIYSGSHDRTTAVCYAYMNYKEWNKWNKNEDRDGFSDIYIYIILAWWNWDTAAVVQVVSKPIDGKIN